MLIFNNNSDNLLDSEVQFNHVQLNNLITKLSLLISVDFWCGGDGRWSK